VFAVHPLPFSQSVISLTYKIKAVSFLAVQMTYDTSNRYSPLLEGDEDLINTPIEGWDDDISLSSDGKPTLKPSLSAPPKRRKQLSPGSPQGKTPEPLSNKPHLSSLASAAVSIGFPRSKLSSFCIYPSGRGGGKSKDPEDLVNQYQSKDQLSGNAVLLSHLKERTPEEKKLWQMQIQTLQQKAGKLLTNQQTSLQALPTVPLPPT
jgi:hypothetical protein